MDHGQDQAPACRRGQRHHGRGGLPGLGCRADDHRNRADDRRGVDGRLMEKVRITSADVAARAGVSQSVVSRVFTPGASASARTAEKVRKAAAELGYRPNVIARTMASGRSRIIGLVVAYLENYFYPEALEKLSKALQDRGYHVLMFMAQQ